jgi:protein import protein ZIM17
MQGPAHVALRHRKEPKSHSSATDSFLFCLFTFPNMSMNAIGRNILRTSQTVFRDYHAPFRIAQRQLATQRQLHSRPAFPSRLAWQRSSRGILNQIRRESTEAAPYKPFTKPETTTQHDTASTSEETAARKAQEPAYEITFTCRKCLERSSHRITKQAYHFGTTLITCPGCKNRHLISDHLKIFSDKSITLEDILREKGQFLKKGRLGEDGDVEFYDETSNEIGQMLAQQKDTPTEGKD